MYYLVHNKSKKLRLPGRRALILHQRECASSQGRDQSGIVATLGEQDDALKVRKQRLRSDSGIQVSGYDSLRLCITQHLLKIAEPCSEKLLHARANQFILRTHLQREIANGTPAHLATGLFLNLLLLQYQIKEAHYLLLWRKGIREGWFQDSLFKPLPLAIKSD